MCNNATDWPALPDVPTVEKEPVPASTEQNSHIIKLLLAVICPVAILGKHFSHILSHFLLLFDIWHSSRKGYKAGIFRPIRLGVYLLNGKDTFFLVYSHQGGKYILVKS